VPTSNASSRADASPGKFAAFDRNQYAPVDPETRALHDDLIRLRNACFADSGDTDTRWIVNVGEELGLPRVVHVEGHRPIERDQWMRVVALATAQASGFKTGGDAVLDRLYPVQPVTT
jgi:hypothetical protein